MSGALVSGVQTCALPFYNRTSWIGSAHPALPKRPRPSGQAARPIGDRLIRPYRRSSAPTISRGISGLDGHGTDEEKRTICEERHERSAAIFTTLVDIRKASPRIKRGTKKKKKKYCNKNGRATGRERRGQ